MGNDEFGGPFVAAAVICERVLQERDGVNSLVRMVDRQIFQAIGPGAATAPAPPLDLQFYIALKAGDYRGAGRITITPITPIGKRLDTRALPMAVFDGPERGVNFAVRMQLPADEPGLYWFEVRLENEVLTKIPYRLVHDRTEIQPHEGG